MSDKRGRLKPCLRCGYSLVHIAGARNCPECGLAVRVSLSDNRGLPWSNPRWQRYLAVAFGLMAFGFFCTILGSVGFWITIEVHQGYYSLHDADRSIVYRFSRLTGELSPVICGLALCLLAKGEQRYPDKSLGARRIALGAGIFILILGLLEVLLRRGIWNLLPTWGPSILSRILSGPWIPLIITILACSYALSIGKRGHSPLLSRLSQVPIYLWVVGFWVWLLNLHRLFWPLRSIVWEWLFPLSMIAMLVLTVRVLLSNAREADSNWTTDP